MVTPQGVLMMAFVLAALLAAVALNWESSSMMTRTAMVIYAILIIGAMIWAFMSGTKGHHLEGTEQEYRIPPPGQTAFLENSSTNDDFKHYQSRLVIY